MRTIKISFIVCLIAASVGFINFGDTSAIEIKGAAKISVSKDAEPGINSISLNPLGIMTASWYGPRFHGKLTANGEQYNQMALTAAHKSLPFGTLIKVTNIKNGKWVFARINDRGPFVEGRDLDLSKGTAGALGLFGEGILRVKVEAIAINNYSTPVSTLN